MEFPKLDKNQWIGVGALVVIGIILSLIFTNWWKGHAIEISVENTGTRTIFAYIDNTGRHGPNTPIEKIQTTNGQQTPSGLIIRPTQIRSFGLAVGLGDSPTLHVLPINENMIADANLINDCTFDTLELKLRIPNRHIKIEWTDDGCDISR